MKLNLATPVRWFALGAGVAVAAYVCHTVVTFGRYGHPSGRVRRRDAALDRLLPECEVAERHCIFVTAPAGITYAAMTSLDLQSSAIVAAIFKVRELVLGGHPQEESVHLGLVDQAKAWGWGVLAEDPGREIVFGAVTRPWVAEPIFRALPPDEFTQFHEPGFVKIAWTLRVFPLGSTKSLAWTETRVVTTDPISYARFRKYWALVSPGVVLIRLLALRQVKAVAERRPSAGKAPIFLTPR